MTLVHAYGGQIAAAIRAGDPRRDSSSENPQLALDIDQARGGGGEARGGGRVCGGRR